MLGDLKTGISYETSSNFDILTHYQTGWNVTKCHACHAKRHDNFVRNPVEPDLALHQSLPEPSPEPSPEPTWLCTKASRNFLWNLLRNLVELPWKPSKRRGFAASPIDTANATGTPGTRRDTWEHQNDHLVRDFRRFSQLAT